MSKLPSISPATLAKLAKLGIHHRADLLLHLPLRYEDETRISPVDTVREGVTAQVQGIITHCQIAYRPRRTLLCRLRDAGGELYLRFLSFYPSQKKQLSEGKLIRAIGEVRLGYFGLEMVHPKCREVSDDTPLRQSLTPVYPTTAGLSQTTLRKLIGNALDTIELTETLPEFMLTKYGLTGFEDALRALHDPAPDIAALALEEHSHPTWRRIKFDELLAQQLSMRVHRHQRGNRIAAELKPRHRLTAQLIEQLPFALTIAQQRCFAEISDDMAQTHPMQRLLLGDVGSGKTVVAALGALQAIENGYQVAMLAPTEILAEQHYMKLRDWLEPLGINVAWLAGSLRKKDKEIATESISSGKAKLAIGTHALFQAQIKFHKLGLAIVDEQHKFGVQQRLALKNKGAEPHQLMMSATPIPRTLAMSYYADLEVSVIDELPPGRTPVVTKLVSDARREEVIARVRDACVAGQQAYWVCPLIDESEALQLQTAQDTFQQLGVTFPELRVGLVHGKLGNAEKQTVMSAFKHGAIQLLVATTVIEVGVDVPNASLMVIDHAERMGLAQLHQLRGRVGRGSAQSACILLYQQPLSELARARLRIIYESNDGFAIAQQDMKLRGPGELLGARQSGVAMLRYADISVDEDLLDQARESAETLLEKFPEAARAHLHRWLANKQDYLHV
ncbi:MAG: ATP-dependent DNA helicase RecG [Gallionella sp.]